MKELYTKWKSVILVSVLAAFSFVFLGTEYLFDDSMALLCSAREVVIAQGYILGASVAGYISFYFVQKLEQYRVLYKMIFGICGMLYAACMLIFVNSQSYIVSLSAGIVCFMFLGMFGSASCYYVTRVLSDFSCISRIVGISYAAGIGIQYINNNIVSDPFAESIVLMLFGGCLVVLILGMVNGRAEVDECEACNDFTPVMATGKAVLLLTVIVVLLTCIFSTLDNAVTLVHAGGTFNIGQWPRLFLAAAGLLAGFLFDIWERRYMHVMMYGVALLALISLIVMGFGGPFIVGLIVFYISAGFFVVYFMSAFMEIASFTEKPALWSGMGRAINNLVSVVISISSVALLLHNMMAILIVEIILLVGLSVCVMLYQKRCYYDGEMLALALELARVKEEIRVRNEIISEEKRLCFFSEKYGLTQREMEVVAALMRSEDSIQELAKELALSRTALYRHLTSIQEKVGVSSRIGIIRQFYHENYN